MPSTKEGVMVWRYLTSDGFVGPYFFKETVTNPGYKQMLVDCAWSHLKCKRLHLQYDEAGTHYVL